MCRLNLDFEAVGYLEKFSLEMSQIALERWLNVSNHPWPRMMVN